MGTVALAASSAVAAAPAGATVADRATPCLRPISAETPVARRIADTAPVPAAVRQRVERQVAAVQRSLAARSRTSAAANTAATLAVYRVKVQIHIIHGTKKGESRIKRTGARRLFLILRNAYDGAESPGISEPMGLVFDLKAITVSRNEKWYHARPLSQADQQMKRKLHRGTAQTLNIYVNAPRFSGGALLLGYSRFPWQYARHASQDGVTVNGAALPGGSARGYNLGDTVVHETGHWLGLLHTFQDGCSPYNDGVADTPAEMGPNFRCSDTANICNPSDLATMRDPAYNFMEYTYDSCMRTFTHGQHVRFAQMFRTYRYGR